MKTLIRFLSLFFVAAWSAHSEDAPTQSTANSAPVTTVRGIPVVTNLPPGQVPTPVVRALAAEGTYANAEAEALSGAQATTNALSQSAQLSTEQRIELASGGARADYGLLKVFFPADIGGDEPVTVQTADGRTLAFRPTFLALRDAVSGESRLLGQVTNRIGMVVSTNWVVFTNAFSGIHADIRYRYSGGPNRANLLEQDILLHESVAVPSQWPQDRAQIEVWSEYFGSEPSGKETYDLDLRGNGDELTAGPAIVSDDYLAFGSARIGAGHAFSSRDETDKVPVAKLWARVEQRDWLIEAVDYLALKPKLEALPVRQAALPQGGKGYAEPGLLIRSLRTPPEDLKTDRSMWLVSADPSPADTVVLDFVIVSSVPVPSGIISWWPAGGNPNDAIGSNHGALSNGVIYSAGMVGQAFSFKSNANYVRITNAVSLNPTNGLTVEAWIFYPSNKSGANMPIVSKDAGGARQYLLTKYFNDKLRAHVGVTNGVFYYTDGQTALQPNAWYHVAMTYSAASSQLSIYVNGALDTNVTVNGSLLTTAQPLYVGGAPPFGYYWTGGIDETSLYDRALSASELQAIYNAGVAGKHNPTCVTVPTNIVAWWPGDGNSYDLARTNFATLNGASYAAAVVSSGFSFDGTNDGVTAAGDQILNLGASDNLTIEAWVHPLANTNDYGVMTIVSKRDTSNPYSAVGYELFLEHGAPGFQIANASGYASFTITNDLRSGFHHLAVTLNRSLTNGVQIYVDGISVKSFNPTVLSGSLSNAAPLRIGVHPQSGFDGYYKGIIDEVTIYWRALTNTEIAALYSAGAAGKCKTDLDNDGLPDWWEIRHFGNLDETASGDYDGDNVTNGTEYTNGTDPNTIHFSITPANKYVNSSSAPILTTMFEGEPSIMAVLVDSTNFPTATWSSYNSNPVANLGSTEGWHQVWVGLRGLAPDSPPVWKSTRVKLDVTPPLLIITNPAAFEVSKPTIQVQGFSPEVLGAFVYDLTNATRSDTNQQALVLSQKFNTNTWEFTTNYFQCFDVLLANGTNRLTLRATDLAGNITTTNLTFIRDYSGKTNPPALRLDWPRHNTRISGDSFTARGWLDDPTAQVAAQIVGTNGVTNIVSGRVGRAGDFWIENLPLVPGTNLLSLIATDVATNSASTNISVVRSDVTFTMAPVTFGQGASGTINDTNRAVWVNGVRATVNGNGTWSITAPRLTLDNAVAQARAIPNSDNGGSGSGSSTNEPNPSSNQAVDVELQLAWPAGLVYASSLNIAENYTLKDTNGVVTDFWHDDTDWDESAGGSELTEQYHGACATSVVIQKYESGRWPAVDTVFTSTSYNWDPRWGCQGPTQMTNNFSTFPSSAWWFGRLEYEALGGQLVESINDQYR